MIYLTTGANGAGKTLFTLKDVREQQLKENRAVYYHGFEAGQVLVDWGWLPFNPEAWQELPDGSICIFDECQNEFPAKIPGAVPEYINAIAQYRRKRGFDFWLISPHPSLIHINVRRLIENPSWHRHLKRAFGADMVSQLKFNAPNLQCEKPGAGASAQVSMRAFPKEVYDWYKSASLHTGKKTIPKQVYMLALAALLVPAGFYFAYKTVTNPKAGAAAIAAPASAASAPRGSGGSAAAVMTAGEYIQSFTPRIPGLPSTAPRYDDVAKAVQAPKPSACVLGQHPGQKAVSCECFTQQATKLDTPFSICKQIALNGWFDDGLTVSPSSGAAPRAAQAVFAPGGAAAPGVAPGSQSVALAAPDLELMEFIAKRRNTR